jgi:hypothetical protein
MRISQFINKLKTGISFTLIIFIDHSPARSYNLAPVNEFITGLAVLAQL